VSSFDTRHSSGLDIAIADVRIRNVGYFMKDNFDFSLLILAGFGALMLLWLMSAVN